MHVTNWTTAQREDPKLDAVLHWLEAMKKIDLRTLLGLEAMKKIDLRTLLGRMLPVRRADSMEELPKFHSPPTCPLSALHAQRGE